MPNINRLKYLLFFVMFASNVFGAEFSESVSIELVDRESIFHLNEKFSELPLMGRLTPFWAQEYVGADLAREYLRTQRHKTKCVEVGISDSGFDLETISPEKLKEGFRYEGKGSFHGTSVANLFLGREPFGVAEFAKISLLNGSLETHDLWQRIQDASTKKLPRIINISKKFDADGPLDSIAVIASGNDWPNDKNEISELSSKTNGIFVGSLSPIGTMSHFSNEGEDVVIAAPSDDFVYTPNGMTNDKNQFLVRPFGGTSGAAPIVSGAIANVLSLLESFDVEHAKILLAKSALNTANAYCEFPANGAGMVNAYKMVRVADRLYELGFDTLSSDEKINLLNRSEIYDFSQEALAFEQLAYEKLHQQNIKGALKNFRAAFLLEPNRNVAKHLEKIYLRFGFDYNARFYKYFFLGEILFENFFPKLSQKTREQLESEPSELKWAELYFRSFLCRPSEWLLDDIFEIGLSIFNFIKDFDPEFVSYFPLEETERGERLTILQCPGELNARGHSQALEFLDKYLKSS